MIFQCQYRIMIQNSTSIISKIIIIKQTKNKLFQWYCSVIILQIKTKIKETKHKEE